MSVRGRFVFASIIEIRYAKRGTSALVSNMADGLPMRSACLIRGPFITARRAGLRDASGSMYASLCPLPRALEGKKTVGVLVMRERPSLNLNTSRFFHMVWIQIQIFEFRTATVISIWNRALPSGFKFKFEFKYLNFLPLPLFPYGSVCFYLDSNSNSNSNI